MLGLPASVEAPAVAQLIAPCRTVMVMMMGCNCWITSENDVNEDVVNNNGDDLRQTAQRTKLSTEPSYAASSPMMMMTAMRG